MIELAEIDNLIERLLDYLKSIQNEDGSFDTFYCQPHYQPEKGWRKWQKNAPVDTASVLIPLLFLHSKKADGIVQKGTKFLQKTSLDNKMWRYAPTDEFVVPYDTDSTAQCSYVLSKIGCNVNNSVLLNSFINHQNHYGLFILPSKKNLPVSRLTKLKFRCRSKKNTPFDKLGSEKDDYDFATSCNCLLYSGKNTENLPVWNEIKQNFEQLNFYTTYYDVPFSIYAYARLFDYGKYKELLPHKQIIENYSLKYADILSASFSLDKLLLVNSLLFFGYIETQNIIEKCFDEIKQEKFKENAPYYSSHSRLYLEPTSQKPYTFFGASAITCSLYLEFLNLCKKRFYNLDVV